MELRKLMRKLSARIGRETFRPAEENTNIPSGYTYLLQFIAHDMVNTSISLAATNGRRFGFQNARQQPLTLRPSWWRTGRQSAGLRVYPRLHSGTGAYAAHTVAFRARTGSVGIHEGNAVCRCRPLRAG